MKNKTLEELYKLREEALWNITGTAYWNEVVKQLTKEINEREKECQKIIKLEKESSSKE